MLESLYTSTSVPPGGVQLNIRDKEGVRNAWNTICNNLEKLGKSEGFQGVTVQRQLNLSDGYELIFGCNLDSQVGPVIVFGTLASVVYGVVLMLMG